MDLSLPADVADQLSAFEVLLGSLESKLNPYTSKGAQDGIEQLSPLERAQTHLALAHAAHILFQLFLKASGVDPAAHESSKEQERLKLYTKKVRKVAAEKELKESRRSLEVNVAAVNRFISAAVPDLSRQQKAALRGPSQQPAAQAAGRKRKGGTAAQGNDEEDEAAEAEAAQAAQDFLVEAIGGLAQEQAAGQGKKPPGSSEAKRRR